MSSLMRYFCICLICHSAVVSCVAELSKPCPYRPIETRQVVSDEIETLLKAIPLTTTWKDVPVEIQNKLAALAQRRLHQFDEAWGAKALSQKEHILLYCPTSEMSANEDRYYRLVYNNIVPLGFSVKDLGSSALRKAMIMNYLGTFAALRATVVYPGPIPGLQDWDGVSFFDSVRLPDERAYNGIMNYNAKVKTALEAIPDGSLSYLEKQIKQYALYDARAHEHGAFNGDGYGGYDMQSPCEGMQRAWDIDSAYQGKNGRPKIFKTDAAALIEVNALFSDQVRLRWVNVGTVATAKKYCDYVGPDTIIQDIGDPALNEVAKGLILMKSWWLERLSSSSNATDRCSVYSKTDRKNIWEAFSADLHFDNDGSSSMASESEELERFTKERLDLYRVAARTALERVFPDDSILTNSERAAVLASVDADNSIGTLFSSMPAKIDRAAGTTGGAATSRWKQIVDEKVIRIGGGYNPGDQIRAEDQKLLNAMFEEVKNWIANRYSGYPIDLKSLYPHIQFTITTNNNADTQGAGHIYFGIGTSRSKYEYYSIMIHELRHAVAYAWEQYAPDKTKVHYDIGAAVEGSGVAVEDLLLRPFTKEILRDDTALSLYELDYGIRDARFIGTTDATLQKYLRAECRSGDDTIAFTEKIAEHYGLGGPLAENAAIRAHAGTQYFQYVLGGMQVEDAISHLQTAIDPSKTHMIDPYVLFACGLNTPQNDAQYVASLRACMKL